MHLDIEIDGWPDSDWPALAERAVEAAAEELPALANERLMASLLFTTDSRVHELNKEWRGKDKPTNVLSFPMLTADEFESLAPDGPPEMFGDLALAYETCAREAAEKAIPIEDHTAHLIVHGMLHLAGYDHETSDEDAEEMEALEVKILARLGVADPYDASNAIKRDS
ncbi:rRNA maturation RNase YbeY [Blastomonas marina]|uniref:rRNA maturation RNase YbeY n=1 Tax=Blastomonas marina TaxID=1867408 RepID=UPI002AC8CD41|nr:rRNA maturation RNase YbeY [Blastomonas marina]WPZ02715.1 rRNA maturation RNase YbeY [Blastomonas marina]